MPLLTIAHQQYWSPNAAPALPPPPSGSGTGGYPVWQITSIGFLFLLMLLVP